MAGRVAFVGEILVDFLGEGGDTLERATAFRPAAGGAPANAAVAAARAGAAALFVGCVGTDAFGRLLRTTLVDAGVDVRHLRAAADHATTLAFVMPAAQGDHGFQFLRGADAALAVADLPPDLFAGLAGLGCGGVSLSAPSARQATLAALRQARAARALTLFDVNWRPFLWPSAGAAVGAFEEAIALADLVKCNETELELLRGPGGDLASLARSLLQTPGPAAVVVTLGHRGALWVSRTVTCHEPAVTVRAVDAVGAGDCFTGTLLAWFAAHGRGSALDLDAASVSAVLARCNAAAALSTLHPGAMAAMPTAAEVDACLAGG